MKAPRVIASAIAIAGLASGSLTYADDAAADGAAGQKVFASTCAGCHQMKSYAGKSEAQLETALKGIVAGTVKHPKKLTLSAADISNVATYIAANEPK
jgi:mono/diheme cytochrome c family protein